MMSENEPVSISLAEIEQQARKLSAEDRARLVEAMLQSLQDSPASEIEAAWQQEIRDRVAAYDRGESRTYPAEDVFAEARHIVE
ncbi:MAG: addiction module protein [Pseudomonadota bacterium]